MLLTLALAAGLVIANAADARIQRSAAEVAAFKRQSPCPSTGLRHGSCPGWIVDHIEPLCAGGADHRSNMQYQTVEDAKAKDREERRMCRDIKQSR